MAFSDAFLQIRYFLRATRLNVLIWGPGTTAGEHFEKRQKIMETVKATFPHADVRFSEDPELRKLIPHAELLAIPQQEAWHLATCDICIVLDTAKGAGEETAHFVGSKDAYKLHVFTDEKYKDANSFPAELRKYANQVFYTKHEYDSCSLTEKVITLLDQKALGTHLGMRT